MSRLGALSLTSHGRSRPAFDHASTVVLHAVSAAIQGGPTADASLEHTLSEASQDAELSAAVMVVLARLAGNLAGLVAELDPDQDDFPQPDLRSTSFDGRLSFEQQVETMLGHAEAVAAELLDGGGAGLGGLLG